MTSRTASFRIPFLLGVTFGLVSSFVAIASSAAAVTPKQDRRPVVTVVDYTGGAWPVKTAARAWSHPHLLRVIVRDVCEPRTYCVSVVAGSYGSEWMGGTTHAGPRGALVYLNDAPEVAGLTSDPVVRSGVVCHELAHVFGIDHQPPSVGHWGCIANSDHAHTTAVPSYRDWQLLRASARDPFGAQWGAFRWHAERMLRQAEKLSR